MLKHTLGFINMNSPIKVIYYYFKREKNMKRNLHLELSKINATIIFYKYNFMNTEFKYT